MTATADLYFEDSDVAAGIAGLARLFEHGAATPSSVLQTCLRRIACYNPVLGAFVELDPDGAARAAAASDARWQRGAALSPLDGVPVGIKVNIAGRGLRWTAGIGGLRDRIATEDAACVARLRRAGAVIVGTLNMDEGGLGARTDNPWFGRTFNPHATDHTAGGSSGGAAAAVAAGLIAGALGTDTMGSVRLPAACCGIVGHDPERGRVERTGVTPLAERYDNVGMLARSVEDARLLLDVTAARASRQHASTDGQRPLAVLTIDDAFEVDAANASAFAEAIEAARAAGLQVRPLRFSDIDLRTLVKQLLLVVEVEGFALHEALLREQPERFSPQFAAMLEWGARQPPARLAAAVEAIGAARNMIQRELMPFAGLLTPAMPSASEAFSQATPWNRAIFTALGSISGLPATVLQSGVLPGGLPTAMQVIAASDSTAFGIAQTLAHTRPRHPVPAAYRT